MRKSYTVELLSSCAEKPGHLWPGCKAQNIPVKQKSLCTNIIKIITFVHGKG